MIAGCGGGSGAVESKERVPEANVDPSRIDSGSYIADNGFGYSADVWYIDGRHVAPRLLSRSVDGRFARVLRRERQAHRFQLRCHDKR